MTIIEHLSRYSGPRVIAAGWTVRIDVYYLGGLRHFYRWEIGDIGLLVFVKRRNSVFANKVVILQSKRLYPNKGHVVELTREDYTIGFGTLLPGASSLLPLSGHYKFPFTAASKYQALLVDDDQYKAIGHYESTHEIPVHYLLYNPWVLPVTYTFPVLRLPKLGAAANGGVRIAPAANVRKLLSGKGRGYAPSFSDLTHVVSKQNVHASGWRLEHFMSSLVMRCQEGKLFPGLDDENIFALFNRRSGPIAAAVAVTVEQQGD
jgi:hypothetical protein